MTQAAGRPRRVPLGLAALLAALSILSPFAIDTFFPAMRAMAVELNVGPLAIQQLLTSYMIPYGVMLLVHGPLSDALGRRPVILWGVAGFALASAACVVAPGYWSLLAFRALQGMTAGAGMSAGRAIVRDLYEGAEAQRLMNAVTMFFSIAPALAPVIGGWIYVRYGWREIFAFLTLLGALVWIAAYRLLPESHPPTRRVPLDARALLALSWQVLRNREFLLLATAASINFCGVLIYVGSAPAIVMDTWGLSETQFAALFVPVIGGFLLGALVSSRMAGRMRRRRQLGIGLACAFAGSIGTILLQLPERVMPLLAQQLMLTLTTLGVQLIVPLIQLRMLDLYPRARGSVTALATFLSLMLGALVMGVLAPALQGSLVLIGMVSASAAPLTLLLLALVRRTIGAS